MPDNDDEQIDNEFDDSLDEHMDFIEDVPWWEDADDDTEEDDEFTNISEA